MLKGSFANRPPYSKLLILIMLVITFLLFSTLFGILVLMPFYGAGIIDVFSNPDFLKPEHVAAFKVMQIINTIGAFLLPALLYLWLCYPNVLEYAGLRKSPFITLFVSACLLIIMAQPIVAYLAEWNSKMQLPSFLSGLENWMKNSEKTGQNVIEAFFKTSGAGGLAVNIIMIALLPALAEEIFFRGVLANLFKDWSKNVHIAVWLSAFIFSAIHLQFYGFLPRFLLGVLLGYLFFWTQSLWVPVIAHFTNNFLAVMAGYSFRKGWSQIKPEELGTVNNPYLLIVSIAITAALLYYIYRATQPKPFIETPKSVE